MFIKRLLSESKSLINERQGFALLELIITLTLLSIILAMGFMFYSFGVVSYNIGKEQTDVQQNTRLAADFITKELRVAEKVVIVNDYNDLNIEALGVKHDPIESPVYYIYIKDNKIYYHVHEEDGEVTGNTSGLTPISENISDNIEFDLKFRKSASGEGKENILEFDLSAINVDSGREYNLDTQLLVLNLDEVEVDGLIDGSGTALVYQVPAPPLPAIRDIILVPQDHEWFAPGDAELDVHVRTVNADGFKIKAEYFSLDENGIDEMKGESGENGGWDDLVGSRHEFLDFKVPGDLDYGYYYLRVTLKDDPLDYEYKVTQGRFYYVYPLIEDLAVTPRSGRPFLADFSMTSNGIPEGTVAVIGTVDMIEGDDFENIIILAKADGQYMDPNNLELHGGATVDSSGSLDFSLKLEGVDYDEYTQKGYKFEVYIGRVELEEYFNVEVYLSDLSITPGELEFGSEKFDYAVQIDPDVTEVYVTTTIADTVEDVYLTINGDRVDSGVSETISLNDLGADNKITVNINSSAGTVLNTYTITIEITEITSE